MEEFVILHQIVNQMITLHLKVQGVSGDANLTFALFSYLSTDYEFVIYCCLE